jgi:hypothetical protein
VGKQLRDVPSVPAIIRRTDGVDEHVILLTNPARPSRVILLPKDGGVPREIGESPMPKSRNTRGVRFV